MVLNTESLQSATYNNAVFIGDEDNLVDRSGKIADIVAGKRRFFDRYFGDEKMLFLL